MGQSDVFVRILIRTSLCRIGADKLRLLPGAILRTRLRLVLVNGRFTQPYSKIQFLVDAGIAQRQTASEYLQELEKLGILIREKRGREVLHKHPALLKVLTT